MVNAAQRPRVLSVDDNPIYQELHEEILGVEFDLVTAAGKEEAIGLLREREFCVALLDMRLQADERGNTDGLEVAEYIRDFGYSTAIIVISGFPVETDEIAARMRRLELAAVLDKSVDGYAKRLRAAVSNAVSRQRSSDT